MLSIDVDVERSSSRCPKCGELSYTSNGFVYDVDDAFGLYYASWSKWHSLCSVNICIAIGEWGDGSSQDDRESFGLELTGDGNKINVRILDPDDSYWPYTELLGSMLLKKEAVNHPEIDRIYEIVEIVYQNNSSIRDYLESCAL